MGTLQIGDHRITFEAGRFEACQSFDTREEAVRRMTSLTRTAKRVQHVSLSLMIVRTRVHDEFEAAVDRLVSRGRKYRYVADLSDPVRLERIERLARRYPEADLQAAELRAASDDVAELTFVLCDDDSGDDGAFVVNVAEAGSEASFRAGSDPELVRYLCSVFDEVWANSEPYNTEGFVVSVALAARFRSTFGREKTSHDLRATSELWLRRKIGERLLLVTGTAARRAGGNVTVIDREGRLPLDLRHEFSSRFERPVPQALLGELAEEFRQWASGLSDRSKQRWGIEVRYDSVISRSLGSSDRHDDPNV